MTTRLPTPPQGGGWPEQLSQALQSWFTILTDRLGVLEIRTTDAGRIQLCPVTKPKKGELTCDGALVSRTGQPALYRAIGTTFNTGGETTAQFRVPVIPSPKAGLEYRISTGA